MNDAARGAWLVEQQAQQPVRAGVEADRTSAEGEKMATMNDGTRPRSSEERKEEERLNPGSEPNRVAQPQPRRRPQHNEAALPGSQNADLKGLRSRRGRKPTST